MVAPDPANRAPADRTARGSTVDERTDSGPASGALAAGFPGGGGDADRGQLLLVGSVALGIIIVGLVVAVNSLLVTDNVASGGSIEVADDAAAFDAETVRNTRELIVRVNHGPRERGGGEIAENVTTGVRNYSRVLSQTAIRSDGAVVNVSYRNDTSEWGTRIVQVEDGPLQSPGSGVPVPVEDLTDWDPVVDADVGRFLLNLNVSAMPVDETAVTFDNGTETYEAKIKRPTPTSQSLRVDIERSYAPDATVVCDAQFGGTRKRILLDLKTGTVLGSECSPPGVRNASNESQTLAPPYDVSVEDGDVAVGKYGIVVNETDATFASAAATYDYGDCTAVDADDLCSTPAVWNAAVTVTYQSDSVDYTQGHNVSVYP